MLIHEDHVNCDYWVLRIRLQLLGRVSCGVPDQALALDRILPNPRNIGQMKSSLKVCHLRAWIHLRPSFSAFVLLWIQSLFQWSSSLFRCLSWNNRHLLGKLIPRKWRAQMRLVWSSRWNEAVCPIYICLRKFVCIGPHSKPSPRCSSHRHWRKYWCP